MTTQQLTKHIWRHEVACKCGCGFDAADIELVEQIEDCIAHFEQAAGGAKLSAVFNSWCRCPRHNKAERGKSTSQHLLGRAVDFYIIGVEPNAVANWLCHKYPQSHGIGRYNSFTHFDRRPNEARWDNRAKENHNDQATQ